MSLLSSSRSGTESPSLPTEKLQFLASPRVDSRHENRQLIRRTTEQLRHQTLEEKRLPVLKRYEEPTILEIFYDLFFAGAYNVFSSSQQVTNHATFKASVGFFCLLWLTWFVVTLYDVRFVTDSIFARVTRAIQLGVMIGFVVMAPEFNPENTSSITVTAMAIILMFSRLCLCLEYGITLWTLWKYKAVRAAFYAHMVNHFVAAVLFLAIGLSFDETQTYHGIAAVYVISGVEACVATVLSNFWETMTLVGTHLMKRLTLLTVLILGEGIQQVAQEVATIVHNPHAWDALTIGQVTAAAATIYFIFLVYFDWLRDSEFILPSIRQQVWSIIHLPFHLALVLFMQGFTQFLIWSKLVSLWDRINDLADPYNLLVPNPNQTSAHIAGELNRRIQHVFANYPPKINTTWITVDATIANISAMPDSIWPIFARYADDNTDFSTDNITDAVGDQLNNIIDASFTLASAVLNAVFAAFGVDLSGDVKQKYPDLASNPKASGWNLQLEVQTSDLARYVLVFEYGYVATGCTILLMAILAVVSRTAPYKTWWPIARIVINMLLAIGTGLVALLWYNPGDALMNYLWSPWVIPTITLVWTVILVMAHVNGRGVQRMSKRLSEVRAKVKARGNGGKGSEGMGETTEEESKV